MAELTFSRPVRPIPVRLADLAMASLWVASLGAAVVASDGSIGHFVLALEVSVLAGIAWWDSRTLRAPNIAVLPALGATLAAALLFGAGAAASAVAGAATAGTAMLLVAAMGGGRLGGGDIKFGALCGAVCGFGAALTLLAGAFIGGGLVAAVALGLRLRRRSDVMAFTPLLLFGTALALAIHGAYHQP